MKNKKAIGLGVKVAVNVLLMMAVGVFLIWVGTFWLDSWTGHGKYLEVPNVKGLQYEKACELLEASDFEVVLSDSLYDNKTKPGCVIEQNPKVGSKVKDGRTIYLTVNAFSPRTVTIPTLTDISLRQAQSILEGLGIKKIEIKKVPSDYKDLVLGAYRDGRRIMAGARVPVTSCVTLEVGEGAVEQVDSDGVDTTYTPPAVAVETLDIM